MKRLVRIAAVTALAVLSAVSCTKEGPRRFEGNYTFKTGGTLSFREAGNEGASVTKVSLSSESGQMDIIETGKGDGEMIVTMNILSGGVVTFTAKAEGKAITLLPSERTISVRLGNGELSTVSADVSVSGTGERYDNIVVFDLEYEGGYVRNDTEYIIVDSSVECVAKLND